MEGAAEALGRPFTVRGVVVEGDRRGRELGFPTANVPTAGVAAAPADGVYAGWLRRLDTGERLPAAISVGTNPTFAGDRERRVESYVLDRTDLELYGVEVEVAFVARLRGMLRFDDVDELVATMHDDVRRAREVLGAVMTGRTAGGGRRRAVVRRATGLPCFVDERPGPGAVGPAPAAGWPRWRSRRPASGHGGGPGRGLVARRPVRRGGRRDHGGWRWWRPATPCTTLRGRRDRRLGRPGTRSAQPRPAATRWSPGRCPLLLLFVTFLFINTEVWQVAAALDGYVMLLTASCSSPRWGSGSCWLGCPRSSRSSTGSWTRGSWSRAARARRSHGAAAA